MIEAGREVMIQVFWLNKRIVGPGRRAAQLPEEAGAVEVAQERWDNGFCVEVNERPPPIRRLGPNFPIATPDLAVRHDVSEQGDIIPFRDTALPSVVERSFAA